MISTTSTTTAWKKSIELPPFESRRHRSCTQIGAGIALHDGEPTADNRHAGYPYRPMYWSLGKPHVPCVTFTADGSIVGRSSRKAKGSTATLGCGRALR